MGLGTVVGTVVGGVATVPSVLVGGLVGAGTGVVHGPWVKLTGMGKGGKDAGGKKGEEVKVPVEAVEDGSVVVDEKTGEVGVRDGEGLRRARERAERVERGEGVGEGERRERRKPRKLEVRSGKKDGA